MKTEIDREAELAEALDNYIDPSHPEFDWEFAESIMRIRPDWFTDEEIDRVISKEFFASDRHKNIRKAINQTLAPTGRRIALWND